jgi:hypothetical protein
LKVGRTALAIVGLVAIALTYSTGNLYFLSIAIIVFFIGLVVMGAIRRPVRSQETNENKEQDKKKKKPRSGEPY